MQVVRNIAKGQIVPLLFQQAAVAANQTDAQLPVVEVGSSPSLVIGIPAPWPGEVVGISYSLDSAGSAGTLSVGVSIGGTEDADTTVAVGTTTVGSLVVPRGKVVFDAEDLIGVEITSDASWNGTTSDLSVWVWVLLHVEGI